MTKPAALYLRRHDLQPYYYAQAVSETGSAINLTGATIRATMRQVDTTTAILNYTITGVTVTAATAGEFQLQWPTGSTATTGVFQLEFEITPSSGGKFTVPVKDDAMVIIEPDLDAS